MYQARNGGGLSGKTSPGAAFVNSPSGFIFDDNLPPTAEGAVKASAMEQQETTPCTVKLFDLARGLAQRVEGQYSRHWAFVPSLYNLYFREQVNLGVSLKSAGKTESAKPVDVRDEDAALAAADLYEKLRTGTYTDQQQKRRIIAGDTRSCCAQMA